MKRKLLLSLLFLSVSLLVKDIVFAGQPESLHSIKKYDRISTVESRKASLSWLDEDKVDTSKLLVNSKASDKLDVLSENQELGVLLLDDHSGSNIVMIQGMGELLLLTYSKEEIERPYNLLEFKVEDRVVSVEQFNYIKALIST